jgi:hypothetical protein
LAFRRQQLVRLPSSPQMSTGVYIPSTQVHKNPAPRPQIVHARSTKTTHGSSLQSSPLKKKQPRCKATGLSKPINTPN